MNATLSTNIVVYKVTALAELACWSKQEAIQLICKQIRQDQSVVIDNLVKCLPGFSKTGIQNIVQHLKNQKLLYFDHVTQELKLSKIGLLSTKKGLSPIFEQGAYSFWIINHELIGTHIIHFERHTDSRNKNQLVSQPLWMKDIRKNKIFTSASNNTAFSVTRLIESANHELMCTIETGEQISLKCIIDDFEQDNQIYIHGKVHLNDRIAVVNQSIATMPRQMTEQIILSLPLWNPINHQVDVTEDQLTVKYPEDFKREFIFSDFNFRNSNEYRLEINDVPVGPHNEKVAAAWGVSLAQYHLTQKPVYLTQNHFVKFCSDLSKDSPLQNFKLLEQQILLNSPKTTPQHRFLIQATQDIPWTQ